MTKALFLKQNLKKGETYAGIILGKKGNPDYHLILRPGQVVGKTWEESMAWAKSVDGELPSRTEQRVLFANAKEAFDEAYYWSNEQHAHTSDYAWGQYFDHGGQGNYYKSSQGRARAVRRLIIL